MKENKLSVARIAVVYVRGKIVIIEYIVLNITGETGQTMGVDFIQYDFRRFINNLHHNCMHTYVKLLK